MTVIFAVGVAPVHLEYRPEITVICWLPFVRSGNGPRVSVAVNSNNSNCGYICSSRFRVQRMLVLCNFCSSLQSRLRYEPYIASKAFASENRTRVSVPAIEGLADSRRGTTL